MKIDQIQPNKENPRLIREEAFEKLKNSIKEDPQMLEARPLIIDENNVVLGGNMRLKALQDLRYEDVPVLQVKDWTPEQKRRFIVKDNLSGGEWDYDLLTAQYDLEELTAWGMENLDNYYIEEPDEKDDIVPETPEEPRSKEGDLYELGEHRLLCGDSTNLDDINKLMNGNNADMVFTDPPYNVDYAGSGKNTSEGIMNDKMGDHEFFNFLVDTFKATKEVTKPGAGCYIFHSHKTASVFEQALKEVGYKIDTQLIWNKPSAGLGMNHYRTKHEPFYYCSLDTDKVFYGDRTGTTVWKIPEDPEKAYKWWIKHNEREELGKTSVWSMHRANVNEYVHPTQKPVELPAKAIMNSSKAGDIVLDQFLGSGTTLISAEKTNRKCYGLELDPRYCDVIVDRWCKFTGITDIKKNGEPYKWELQEVKN